MAHRTRLRLPLASDQGRPNSPAVDTVVIDGVQCKAALAVMTLPYSDAFCVSAFPRECTETFPAGHERVRVLRWGPDSDLLSQHDDSGVEGDRPDQRVDVVVGQVTPALAVGRPDQKPTAARFQPRRSRRRLGTRLARSLSC